MTEKPTRTTYLLGKAHFEPHEYPDFAFLDPPFAKALKNLPASKEIWYVERFSAGVSLAECGPVEVVVVAAETSDLRAVDPVDPRTPPFCVLDALTDAMENPMDVTPRRPAKVCVAKEEMADMLGQALRPIGIKVELMTLMGPVHEAFGRLRIMKRPGVD